VAVEIERKFLVKSDAFKDQAFNSYNIKQGFLNSHKERTVRVRLKKDEGILTIKGESSEDGLTRFEWEKKISESDAVDLLQLCENGIVDKTRYEISSGKHTFEVDEFYGDNKGLIIAEVELKSTDEVFVKPSWLGKEVTGVIKYYNAELSKHPFKSWTI
jgi:CYTH domain-containing protein